ncbi:hypothetical protein CDD81_1486 [Ophiocordyceps australis]|uniref:Uncharacterized protein n=1 Tax=Ophiocordyceps australis TaxID=1399860 RepID=A0A2C5XB82_9HYPO|nr:hypothetical protein CDD81_1486 [Ophiocordyceps australis]
MDQYEQATENQQVFSTRDYASVEGIMKEIDEMKKQFSAHRHPGSRWDKFRSVVSESLVPIEALSEIASQASKAVFPPSEAIFAAVRYLIISAKSVSSDYDRLVEFFEDVESCLCSVKIWENKVPPVPQLEKAITTLFCSILMLFGVYTKYIKKKRIVKAFRNLVSGEDAALKNEYKQFQNAVQLVRDLVGNLTLSVATQAMASLNTNHVHVQRLSSLVELTTEGTNTLCQNTKRLVRVTDGHERGDILKWLSSIDFGQHQRETFAKFHPGTGKWFLDGSKFQDWIHSAQPSTIWCRGDPGTGKTVMMSAAICHVEDHTCGSDTAIAHVYCNYQERQTQLTLEIWSSVIRQLAEQFDPLPDQVIAFRDRFIGKRCYPTEDDMILLVISLSKLFKKVFVFIDALDECPEENREHFIQTAVRLESCIRLFITSRHSVVLENRFSNMQRINLTAHKEDIRAYLQGRLEQNSRLRSLDTQVAGLKAQIVEKLLEQANGMFLLAQLQMDHLCRQRRPLEVRQAMGTLAKNVHEFYAASLQRINQSDQEDRMFALRIISYVFCAKRPLSMDELLHALSVVPGATDMLSEALYDGALVLSVSLGLIRVDDKSGLVRLTHHTLHEHLHKFPQQLFPHHEKDLAISCLLYLSFDAFSAGACTEANSLIQRLEKYPFLEYACRYWSSHAVSFVDEMKSPILALLGNSNRLSSCVQILHLAPCRVGDWHDKYPRNFTPLHASAYWGLDSLLGELLAKHGDVNCRDSYGNTPLMLAARQGHFQVVEQLVGVAAELDLQSKCGETALMLAARNGHDAVVQLLLARGANCLMEDIEGWKALHWALTGNHDGIVKILLNALARIDSDKTHLNMAMILAAEVGSDTTVQMLLEAGANVDYRDDEKSTALHWAVAEGRLRMCQTLLEHGADVNSRDCCGNTPMHWTVAHADIARLLASHKADVNAKNNLGQDTLLWSALAGKLATVKTLLELGAVIQGDQYGFTALHAAALRGHEDIARLLLARGADANLLDKDGWTPLHAAALKQRHALVHVLLDITKNGQYILGQVGARLQDHNKRALMEEMADRKSTGSTVVVGLRSVDVNQADDMYDSTMLTYAAWLGREKTVQLLLSHGADANMTERSGRTALHWAAWHGFWDIVVALVEKGGASIDVRVFGWTPMLLAARSWQHRIVVYLVQRGANVCARDFHGRTALHWSCIHGDKVLAQQLLSLGAQLDAQDLYGQTALHWAICAKETGIAKLLLRRNANMALQARDGSTALHVAAYTGQLDIVDCLFKTHQRRQRRSLQKELGAEAVGFVTDADGFTPLHVADLSGNVNVATFLREQMAQGGNGQSGLQRQCVCAPPPLQLSKDEESDYLSDEGFQHGLGRPLACPEARQWLREKRDLQPCSICA